MRFTESIIINKSAEKVFAVWGDVENYPKWAAPVVERRKITEGPVGVGTRFLAIDQWPGRKVEFEMEITEYEFNKRLGARWEKPIEGNWTSQLTEVPNGTRLDFEIEMHLPFMMRLMSVFMKRFATKQNREFMNTLKHNVEKDADT